MNPINLIESSSNVSVQKNVQKKVVSAVQPHVENPQKESFVKKMATRIILFSKKRAFKKQLLDGIPKPMQKEARSMINDGVSYSSFMGKHYYKPSNITNPVGIDDRQANITLKLDLLAKHDPNIYIGEHAHPGQYMRSTKGYQDVDFQDFEGYLNKKLAELAK